MQICESALFITVRKLNLKNGPPEGGPFSVYCLPSTQPFMTSAINSTESALSFPVFLAVIFIYALLSEYNVAKLSGVKQYVFIFTVADGKDVPFTPFPNTAAGANLHLPAKFRAVHPSIAACAA